MRAPLTVSPSLLGRYFFLDCERMLRFTATPKARRATDGVPARPFKPNVLTEAILEGGYLWEEEVLGKLGKRAVIGKAAGPNTPLRERALSYDATLDALRRATPGTYLYQATLNVPNRFYETYGLPSGEIQFPACRPDLIEVRVGKEGLRLLRVIDVKASDEAKFGHKVQAALYALILRDVLATEGIADLVVDTDACGIWLYGQPEYSECDLTRLIGPLEDFLTNGLPAILLKPAAEARWSLYFRCEWCDYWDHCSSEARQTQDVSLLPYFRPEAKQFLAERPQPIGTIEQLGTYLARPEAKQEMRQCAALAGRHARLAHDVEAHVAERPAAYGASTIALPVRDGIALFLTLQDDPLSGRICAAGVHVYGGKDLFGPQEPWTVLAEDNRDEAFDDVARQFLDRIERLLRIVDTHNRSEAEFTRQKGVQCYVYDSYERTLLDRLLVEALTNPDLAQKALDLFFHFQSEELTAAERHPGATVPHPVVVVTDVLRHVIALPAQVTYRLARVSEVLAPSEYASVYRERDKFAFPLSNRLRCDSLYRVWTGNTPAEPALEEVRGELVRRLKATGSVVRGLRERIEARLFAWPPKFRFPPSSGLRQPVLSRLSFMARYEQVLSYLEARGARALPRSERLEADRPVAVSITLLAQKGEFWIARIEKESASTPPEESDFTTWLLSADDDTGEREQMRFDDLRYMDKTWVPKSIGIAYARVARVGEKSGEMRMALTVKTTDDSPILAKGKRYLMHPRFTDFSTRRVIDMLQRLDGEPACDLVRMLEDPHAWLAANPLPPMKVTAQQLRTYLEPFGFTESQREAFEAILRSRLQLVWGPPGTGKTYFLALAICALAARRKSLRVLVTAFTHAAIENCLKKIVEVQNLLGRKGVDCRLAVHKLGGWRGKDRPDGVADGVGLDAHSITGATVYAAHKAGLGGFDLVVIDEGSQLPVPISAIPIGMLAPQGRLVIAGDDKQLGPILQGEYPGSEEGRPHLFTSIFECLRGPDRERNAYTSQLQECFRLNDVLCRYPAETIYGERFRPFDHATAQRRLKLAPAGRKAEHPAWLEFVLDPAHPLVVVVLKGVQGLAESPVEAALVAELGIAMRERLLDTEGQRYSDDAAFWEHGLFVVSPHHVQIRQIRQRLGSSREWSHPPFVDTVDKMQGREAEAVIVSYGVSDTDYALLEGEFIYSLNRLNVAVTRARSKAVVFLSEQLLSPRTIAFADDDLVEGLDFMLRLRDYTAAGETQEFAVTAGGVDLAVEVLRAGEREDALATASLSAR